MLRGRSVAIVVSAYPKSHFAHYHLNLQWQFHFPFYSFLPWSFVFAPITHPVQYINPINDAALGLSRINAEFTAFSSTNRGVWVELVLHLAEKLHPAYLLQSRRFIGMCSEVARGPNKVDDDLKRGR